MSALTQAMREWAEAMRGDWSDIDGRGVSAVVNDWAYEFDGKREPRSIEARRLELGLCPDGGGHWGGMWGHCDTYQCPTYVRENAKRAAK